MANRIVRRVLVADDDVKQLEAARRWMPGREVLVEHDADSVLARVRNEKPCLVILDLWHVPLDGSTLAAAIKHEFPEIPVAVISAGLTPRVVGHFMRHRVADVVLPKQGRRTFDEILGYLEFGIEPDPWADPDGTVADAKRDYARRLLARAAGNKAEAARRASVTWITLHRWLGETDEPEIIGE